MAYEDTLAAFRRGDDDEAARLAQEDLASARAHDDPRGEVDALCMLARVALRQGRLDVVEERATAAQHVADATGDHALGRMPLHLRAVAARMDGRHDEARLLYLESIDLNDALGEAGMAAAEHRNLAYSEMHAGDTDRALELFAEARRRVVGKDVRSLVPYLTFDEATLAALGSDHVTAAAKLREAEEQFDAQGVVPDPDDAFEIAELRRRLAE